MSERHDFRAARFGSDGSEDRVLVALPVHRPAPQGSKRLRDHLHPGPDDQHAATAWAQHHQQQHQQACDNDRHPPRKRARVECPLSCASSLSPIAWLSDEIRLHVARYCALADLGRLACVSKDWQRVASDPRLCALVYDECVGRCRFDHLCHGVTTDAVSDPAFFTGGLAALGVPDDNAASGVGRTVARDSDAPSAPEGIPHWAVPMGTALAECCVRVARSTAETRGLGTLYDDEPLTTPRSDSKDGSGLRTCRHVPPTFVKAFGVGAAYRASAAGPKGAYDGPRFWYDPADARLQPPRVYRYGRPMGAYMWPCRISTSPPRHTACLYTDGPQYFCETDVSLCLMLADADGRTLWVHAWSRSSADVTVDKVSWYCAGPFPPRTPLHMDISDDDDDDDSAKDGGDMRVSRQRRLSPDQMPLVVCRHSDGTMTCARTGRRVNRKTGVRSVLHDAVGPCLMEAAHSRTTYRGGLAMGVRSGHGIVRTADGVTIYDGLWENDLPRGEGALYDVTGRPVFSGTFRNGAPAAGPGLLRVPPLPTPVPQGNGRPCKVYAGTWEAKMSGYKVLYAVPRGDGHVTLADGTRLDCRWSQPGQPPSVLRVHVPPSSTLSLDGRPCVLDLTVAPPSFYDDALTLLNDDDDNNNNNGDNESAPIGAKRVGGAKAVAVRVKECHRLDHVSLWRDRVPSDLVAHSFWSRGTVAEPCGWIVAALADPSLSFAVDLAPHRPGRLVVNLLDASKPI
nr:F-box domain [Pandoravirus massiliensis]